MRIVEAIKAAYTADATLTGLTPGGLTFEVSKPGTPTNRIVFHIPDDGIQDEKVYQYTKRTMIFMFTVYAESWEKLRQITSRMIAVGGPFQDKIYSLTLPEVSGGSQFDTESIRKFKNEVDRVTDSTASYEYVAELPYLTIINNPQD